jgi:hypothetical protein
MDIAIAKCKHPLAGNPVGHGGLVGLVYIHLSQGDKGFIK